MKNPIKHIHKWRYSNVSDTYELSIGRAMIKLDVSLLQDRFISVQFGEGETVSLKAGQLLSADNWAFCISQTSIYIPEDAREEINAVLRAIWRNNPIEELLGPRY